MRIEYTTPHADYISVEVIPLDNLDTPGMAECFYTPEPIAGLRLIPAGRFKAVGNSGRVEEAVVLFDIRKGEFVIQPKKLVAGGFDFDKPAQSEVTTATPEPDTAGDTAGETPMQISFGGKK